MLGYTAPHLNGSRGLRVKNWTLRQRILASFAVIIAIMLLMVVASYSRLLSIESSEESVRTDAIPGVYYSTMIRSAWVDSYVLTQQLLGFSADGVISAADQTQFKDFESRLVLQINNYQKTIFNQEDQTAFDVFKRDHEAYDKLLGNVLDLYQHKQNDQAIRMFNEQLAPAWAAGRKQL